MRETRGSSRWLDRKYLCWPGSLSWWGEQERGLQQRCSAPRDPWKLARDYDSVVGMGGISMYALRVSGDLLIYAPRKSESLLLLPALRPSLRAILPCYLPGTEEIAYPAACGTSDRDEVSNREILGETYITFHCTASECAGTCQWPRRLEAEKGAMNPFPLSKKPCSQPVGLWIASQGTLSLSSKEAPCVSSLHPEQVLPSFGAGQGRGINLGRCLQIFLVSACQLLVLFLLLL